MGVWRIFVSFYFLLLPDELGVQIQLSSLLCLLCAWYESSFSPIIAHGVQALGFSDELGLQTVAQWVRVNEFSETSSILSSGFGGFIYVFVCDWSSWSLDASWSSICGVSLTCLLLCFFEQMKIRNCSEDLISL